MEEQETHETNPEPESHSKTQKVKLRDPEDAKQRIIKHLEKAQKNGLIELTDDIKAAIDQAVDKLYNNYESDGVVPTLELLVQEFTGDIADILSTMSKDPFKKESKRVIIIILLALVLAALVAVVIGSTYTTTEVDTEETIEVVEEEEDEEEVVEEEAEEVEEETEEATEEGTSEETTTTTSSSSSSSSSHTHNWTTEWVVTKAAYTEYEYGTGCSCGIVWTDAQLANGELAAHSASLEAQGIDHWGTGADFIISSTYHAEEGYYKTVCSTCGATQ